jgi:hypothetical protein
MHAAEEGNRSGGTRTAKVPPSRPRPHCPGKTALARWPLQLRPPLLRWSWEGPQTYPRPLPHEICTDASRRACIAFPQPREIPSAPDKTAPPPTPPPGSHGPTTEAQDRQSWLGPLRSGWYPALARGPPCWGWRATLSDRGARDGMMFPSPPGMPPVYGIRAARQVSLAGGGRGQNALACVPSASKANREARLRMEYAAQKCGSEFPASYFHPHKARAHICIYDGRRPPLRSEPQAAGTPPRPAPGRIRERSRRQGDAFSAGGSSSSPSIHEYYLQPSRPLQPDARQRTHPA